MFCAVHVSGMQQMPPQTFAFPPPPQVSQPGQVAHAVDRAAATVRGSGRTICTQRAAHVVFVHVGPVEGVTHDARSQMRYSSAFSCELVAAPVHSLGNTRLSSSLLPPGITLT